MPNDIFPPHHYVFAHILRGLAAAIVFLGAHILGNFWTTPSAVCQLLDLKPCFTTTQVPAVVIFLNYTGWFKYNHFGVGIFFLISGFVIPFSLITYNAKQFLITRFFRIYPTYWVAFSCALVALLIFHRGLLLFSLSDIFAQMALVRDLFWIPSLDAISWTLEIEIKFYLLCALIAKVLVFGRVQALLLIILLLGLLQLGLASVQFGFTNNWSYWVFCPPWYGIGHALANSIVYIMYMLLGSCYNWHCRNLITTRQLITLLTIIFLWFVLLWFRSDYRSLFYSGIFNYFLALVVFSFTYFFKEKIPAPKPLMWLGSISYPLYAVHLITSYVLLYWLIYIKGMSTGLALIVAICTSIFLALLLHRIVELPSNNYGKKLARLMRKG